MGSSNTPADLVRLMFEEARRLAEGEPGSEELRSEVERARAMADLGKTINGTYSQAIHASVVRDQTGRAVTFAALGTGAGDDAAAG